VTVTDKNGCSATANTSVAVYKGTAFDLGNTLEISEGDSVLLQPIDLNPSQVNMAFWLPNSYLSPNNKTLEVYAKPPKSTLYTLKIKNAQGCTSEDSIWVKIKQRGREIYAPNVFSPNDDSANDIFTIFAGSWVTNIKLLRVYSRWGELIFEKENYPPNDPNQGWDGSYRGHPAPSDVYVFYAVLLLSDGTTKTISGDVTLIR
jgi:gliding motility-associated-like protein